MAEYTTPGGAKSGTLFQTALDKETSGTFAANVLMHHEAGERHEPRFLEHVFPELLFRHSDRAISNEMIAKKEKPGYTRADVLTESFLRRIFVVPDEESFLLQSFDDLSPKGQSSPYVGSKGFSIKKIHEANSIGSEPTLVQISREKRRNCRIIKH